MIFTAESGATLYMNFPAKHEVLDRLTAFWWDKLGVPANLTREDTKIIARLLWNYIKIQQVISDEELRIFGYRRESKEEIDYWKHAAHFFEIAGAVWRDV